MEDPEQVWHSYLPKLITFIGAWGWCTEGGGAWAWRIADFAVKNGLSSRFVDNASYANIKAAIKAGKIVVLSTKMSSVGHIINVHGFDDNGETLLVNDPYGNAREPGWVRLNFISCFTNFLRDKKLMVPI